MSSSSEPSFAWWRLLNRYQWFVLIVASLGWLLDCMDQQLFVLARAPAMRELLTAGFGRAPTPAEIGEHGAYATSIFLLGWATGGLIFGVLGDRWGRAKTMLLTIVLYSGFTGLSAFAQRFWDFALFRFLTGLGVGGEFAVGVALVAEVMPEKARPYALSLLQALSVVGNVTAATIGISLGMLEQNHDLWGWAPWRWKFVMGALPALVVMLVRRGLKEPDRWIEAKKNPALAKKMGDYGELFGNPNWRTPSTVAAILLLVGILIGFLTPLATVQHLFGLPSTATLAKHGLVAAFALLALGAGIWTVMGGGGDTRYRRRAVVGLLLALSGVIGVWGIAFFAADLVRGVLEKKLLADGVDPKLIPAQLTIWTGINSMVQNLGAFFGIYSYGILAQRFGRKPAFAVSLTAAMLCTAATFWFLRDFKDIFIFVPIMGFATLSVFGGYAIYFPELFPTRLRSTGTSFCYNVGRFVAAAGPAALGMLTGIVYKETSEPLRYAGITMCSVYLIGLFALPFAPETKDQPLPEEERPVTH
ncbi:MAG TPA: MFS transporter [Verrucomicrobiota bacterium]|nr:MFS transporter [Verrucomicrobiota bacterium]